MTDQLTVKRGERPTYARQMRRDRRLLANRPRAGRGLLARETRSGTVLVLDGRMLSPHPWQAEAVWKGSLGQNDEVTLTALVRLSPGTVDEEEPILPANADGPAEVRRPADVALSDATSAWMLSVEGSAMPRARDIRKGLPEVIFNMANVGETTRTVRCASLAIKADPMRKRGERFTVVLVPQLPTFELTALDAGVRDFFGLDEIPPVLSTVVELATLWALAPEAEPTQDVVGAGWTLVVQQRVYLNLEFHLQPQVDTPVQDPLLDPALGWFVGRYTGVLQANAFADAALLQLASSFAQAKPPQAAFWT
jgi:hypothetical protein